jgi:glycine/D-amino acid oxidase-like deaminating enzyme
VGSSYDFVIVGAGISGAALAYQLRRRGRGRVLLLERGEAASGGTGKSAALVRQHYSTTLMARLARRSVEIFGAMPGELGDDGGFRRVGYLFLCAAADAATAQRNVAMQQGVGVNTSWLDAAAVAARCGWLNPEGVAGAAFEPEGGYADPVRTVAAYVAAFEREGGEFRRRAPCRRIVRRDGRVAGVVTDDDEIAAGTVVNAAGPWAPSLARLAGVPLDMRSVREQDTVWEGRVGRELPPHSISNAVDAIYLRPQGERRYIVGRGFPKPYEDVDENNYKQTPDDWFVAEVQERLERRFPTMQGARLITAYTALYDVTPDWYPFVGPREDVAGYVDFSGGSGHGFKIAPAIAEELAGWLLDGRVADDFRQLAHDRIAANRPFVQSYGGNRG